MRQLQLFNLSVAGVVKRFYLMMAVVTIAGFLGQFTIASILGFLVAVSFILGVSITPPEAKEARRAELKPEKEEKRIAA